MRQLPLVRTLLVLVVLSPSAIVAQSAQAVSAAAVPRLISLSGVFRPADGQPAGAVETVTLAIYADPEGGVPLWQETQTVALDGQGRYALLLGASQADGIPAAVFAAGDAQWWGLVFDRPGEVEGPRVRITSVPYALRAAEADTLGGRPASDYLLAPAPGDSGSAGAASADATPGASVDATPGASADAVLPGTDNFLAKYVNGGVDVDDSAVFESAGRVGIGTTAPLDALHINFTNTNGAVTGLAVRNLGATTASYSGMLFYDQNGFLGQFQGFNNGTHEYRINNIARVSQPAGAFNGSINFMIGGTSRFFVSSGTAGNIGIGTTAPTTMLEVSNGLTTAGTANISATSYGDNNFGSLFYGRKARGTLAAPTAVLGGDKLAFFGGRGYGATRFSTAAIPGISISATENWTDLAQGTGMIFSTTPNGGTQPLDRMHLDDRGHLNVFRSLGIGTFSAEAALEIVKSGFDGDADLFVTSFDGPGQFLTRSARGTVAAPAAVQDGDVLGVYSIGGYAGTGFVQFRAGMVALAAENWSDTAQGTTLFLATTPVGAVEPAGGIGIFPTGNVGIGPAGTPAAADRLQVIGDIRVGTAGTNGCIKDFNGNPLTGTCASDRRFKKDITPFSHVLDRLTALQPVHYSWRTADFPGQHFGDGRAYGLIAQEVEQTLPELVVTNDDGFKAVDYSKLPLLTIQAVKDLKSENDALKRRGELEQSKTEALEQRVAELERLVNELLAAASRR